VENINSPPPDFPNECPCCGAEIAGGEHGGTPWASQIYACGGAYRPKPQIQNHTYIWWGHCPKAKKALALGLDPRTVPDFILHDAAYEAGLDS
jgi:hypothetical protein